MKVDSDRNGQEPIVEPLSAREIQILELIAENLSKREIAARLSLAYSTVKWYTQQTYRKLAVNSRRQAVQRARELGYLASNGAEILAAAEPLPWIANPYKGLLAFRESDAANFFGREALTARLVARLGEEREAARFLAVVGPSGSGKSSLVNAGLIPALRHGVLPGSEDWFITEMTPGIHPFEELEGSLLQFAADPSINFLEQLEQDERGILRAARLALPDKDSELLLVIDQFEEIFTLVEDKAETRNFLESLCVAVTDPGNPLRVVITLRADFFDRLLLSSGLSRLVQDRTEVVISLSVDEMERAIRAPAEQCGITVESGLVAAIVADMVEQPGALPLLQYALTEIFERRSGRQLALEQYHAIGGVQGVLERRAEETYSGLSKGGKAAARQTFLRLVTLGQGTGTDDLPVPDTRRRVLRSELEAVMLMPHPSGPSMQESENGVVIHEILDAFGKARLLYFDRDALTGSPTVEIAHEALLVEWRRLRGWLDEGRGDVRMQRALGHAAAEWVQADRDVSFLLRDTRLELFSQWVRQTNLALIVGEAEFLQASQVEQERRVDEEAARQERERHLEHRARNFLRGLVGVFAVATVIALLLFGFSRQQARLATSRELASAAISNLDADPARSILLTLQALHAANTQEAIDALHRSIQASRVRMTLTGFTGGSRTVEFSPDGGMLAVATFEGEVSVWDANNWKKLFSLPGSPGRVARFSPDGTRLATGDNRGSVIIWDLANQNKLLEMKGHTRQILDVQFSPDGQHLSSTSGDETFIVWNTKTGQEEFSGQAEVFDWDPLDYVRFSPDGKYLVTSNMLTSENVPLGNEISIWAVDHNWRLVNRQLSYDLVDLSPDGRWLVSMPEQTAGATGISLWDLSTITLDSMDLSTLQLSILPEAHKNNIVTHIFNKDGTLLVTTSMDGTAKVWHHSKLGLELLMTLSGHIGTVKNAAFSPNSEWLATSSEDGTVRIWDISPKGDSEWFALSGHTDTIRRLAITKNGRYLATASSDGTAKVWDLDSKKLLIDVIGKTGLGNYLLGIGISPDGSLLATAGSDNIANIWLLTYPPNQPGAKLQLSLSGHTKGTPIGGKTGFSGLTSAIFSPDGTLLATGGEDGMAKIWDVKTGQELLSIQANPQPRGITHVAFSSDGKYLATTTDGPKPVAKVWDATNGAEKSTFSGQVQTLRISGLAFSPDGERVATGTAGGNLKIWDARTGQELKDLPGHTSTVVGLAFSAEGKYLASSSTDGTARIWNASSGEMLEVFTSPGGPISDLTFTPDGKRLIVTSQDTIYGYILDRDELVSLAESRLTRGFTLEECRQFLHLEQCPVP